MKNLLCAILLILGFQVNAQVKIIGDTILNSQGKLVVQNQPELPNGIIVKQFSTDNRLIYTCSLISKVNSVDSRILGDLIGKQFLVLDGDYISFYDNQDTMQLVHFKNGIKFGKQKKYNENGVKIDELDIINPQMAIYSYFYPSGMLKMKFQLVSDRKQGEEFHYYENGNIKAKFTNVNNEYEKNFSYYNPDNKLNSIIKIFPNSLDSINFSHQGVWTLFKTKEKFIEKLNDIQSNTIIQDYLNDNILSFTLKINSKGTIDQIEYKNLPNQVRKVIDTLYSFNDLFVPEKLFDESVMTNLKVTINDTSRVRYIQQRINYSARLNNNLYTPHYELFQVDTLLTYPEFPGGEKKLREYLAKTTKYPEDAQKNEIEGRVVVYFIIEKNGSVSHIEIRRYVHPLLDEEAIRVVSKMPFWKPGEMRGKKVRTLMTLPINFNLE